MKKFVLLLLALCFVLSITGCKSAEQRAYEQAADALEDLLDY